MRKFVSTNIECLHIRNNFNTIALCFGNVPLSFRKAEQKCHFQWEVIKYIILWDKFKKIILMIQTNIFQEY